MNLRDGDRFHDPVVEQDFTVCESVDTCGVSVAECDRISVRIEYDDGQRVTVPHERFRGRMTYELIERAGEVA